MKPFVGRMLFLAIAALPAALVFPACADSESIIFVRQVQARITSGSSGCAPDNSPTSLYLTEGTLDVAYRHQYTAALLVGNQLVARGNSSQLRTETSRVAIQGAVVQVEDAQGAVVWGPVTVPGSGFIDPATDTDATYGLTDTILLGDDLGQALATELSTKAGFIRHFTSTVRVFGRTLGGTSVESGDWRFPISACFGCLTSFPIDANDPAKASPQPNCDAAATSGSTVVAPCNIGQDDVVDCRVCKQVFPGAALCEPPH